MGKGELGMIKIEERLERAYRESETGEGFLAEILKIWAEEGMIRGEWSCKCS